MSPTIAEELERIRESNGGLLLAEHVVDAARSPTSPLHAHFEWNDAEAAEEWRVEQARRLIRVHVKIVRADVEPTRVYVSLHEDRENGGGYRHIDEVLSEPERRAQLLAEAMRDLEAWRKKYAVLAELVGVFTIADEAVRTHGRKHGKTANAEAQAGV